MASTSKATAGLEHGDHGSELEDERPVDRRAAKRNDLLEIEATRAVTEAEHSLKFWPAIRQYPRATFWSMFFCLAVVMAGFDAQIITSFYALPAFQRDYGDPVNGSYQISAPWQMALGSKYFSGSLG